MTISARYHAFFLLVISMATLAGCAGIKAKPARFAGFIPQENLVHLKEVPFHKVWFKEDVDWTRYTEICITPVHTDYLLKMNWWKRAERPASIKNDVKKLAEYTEGVLKEAFRDDPKHRFQVVDQPGPATLVGEFALVEVVPSKIFLNTLCHMPLIGWPVFAIRQVAVKSTVAFEARVRDGGTGGIVALLADREAEKMAFFNVQDFTWYGHAQSIIREWADQFVKLANKKDEEVIKDSSPGTLKLW